MVTGLAQVDGGPRNRPEFLRNAYVYLQGCGVKCGNCGKPHADHHDLIASACKGFRGWHECDGCEACRNSLMDRLDRDRRSNADGR